MINQLSPSELMRQAIDTAETYFNKAVRIIDETFGEKGYAKEHPELIAGFMRTAAADFNTCMTRQALDQISNNLGRVADAIEGLELIPADSKSTFDSSANKLDLEGDI